tara:strand:- start:597 stop:1010 length:414 start_codon:yes stop_codon:yes gene_type:complete
MGRGRPTETEAIRISKITRTYYDVPSKPELGWKSVWHWDDEKSKNGAWKVEHTPPKGWKAHKVKADKGKAYSKQPVVIVFKTSNRSNAKTKMKIWANENIDYILTAPKLTGVPSTAIILECGVGKSCIEKYASKYSL